MRSTMRELAVELTFSLALILVAEALIRVFGCARLWALVAVFTVGNLARAALSRRRRLVLENDSETPFIPRSSQNHGAPH